MTVGNDGGAFAAALLDRDGGHGNSGGYGATVVVAMIDGVGGCIGIVWNNTVNVVIKNRLGCRIDPRTRRRRGRGGDRRRSNYY